MQKKLIALAIAGLSGAAFAQSNVTVYGVADLNVENVEITGAAGANTNNVPGKMRAANNSSYLGFKGVEDLGNGLKAVFQIETAISLGTNADTKGGLGDHAPASNQFGQSRDSYVGLAGNFGTLAVGTLTGPYRALGTANSYSPGAAGVSFQGAVIGTIGGVKTTTDDRTTNLVAYITPTFSGFNATIGYSADGNKNNSAAGQKSLNGSLWTLGLNYSGFGFTGGYAYINAKDPQVLSSVVTGLVAAGASTGIVGTYNDTLKAHRLAGKYDFGQGTSITALWDKQKYEYDTAAAFGVVNGAVTTPIGAANDYAERKAWQLGVGHTFGANTLALEYARSGKIKDSGGDNDNTQLKQITLQYRYDLSKRTNVKAYYTKLTNEQNTAANFYNNPVASSALDGDVRAFGVGLRHNF